MTAQEVIKNFMNALDNQNYQDGASILDDAVRNSSRFDGVQDALDKFFDAQKAAERTAIQEILGSNYKDEYATLQLEDLLKLAETDAELKAALSETATYSDKPKSYGPEYSGSSKARSFTAAERIRMKTADIFLEECGIELPYKVYRAVSTDTKILMATYNSIYGATGNVDTGAITGADAGGDTAKTPESVVQEIGNKYTAKNTRPQNISTGTNDWIVEATSYRDTITSSGADSISAGDGNDVVYIQGNNATVSAGANNKDADAITVNADVKIATVANLDEYDTLNIYGDFVVKSAKLNDETLTITAENGRTLIIENWTTAKNSAVTVDEDAQKLGAWLSNFVEYEDTSTGEEITAPANEPSPVVVNLDEVTSIGGSFNLASGARSATYNASLTSGNVGTVSSEFANVENFTTRGLNVELWGRSTSSSTSNVKNLSYEDLTDDEKTVFAGLQKWWIKEGLKLNEKSYGLNFTEDGTFKNTLKVFFYTAENSGTLAFVTDSGNNLALAVNMAQFDGISSTDENGEGVNTYLDRTLAHELNHAVMKANIENFAKLPQFITEGLAELVHGIDDERVLRIWDLAARNTTNVGTDTTAATGGTVRLEDALDLTNTATGTSDAYAGGYMFLRWFSKQAAAQTANLPALGEVTVNINLTGENATYYANLTASGETATTLQSDNNFVVGTVNDLEYTPAAGIKQSVSASSGNWKFSSIGDNVTITSGSGTDKAEILGLENNIDLGAGNDTVNIHYMAKNNNINLGNGDNYVSLSGAENTITGGTGSDIISFVKYSNVEGSASNNYIATGGGNDSLNINGSNNTIDAGAGDDTVLVFSNESSIDGSNGNDFIYISASDNTIFGGNGNDTIRIQKSADVSEVTIADIAPDEDVLLFGGVIDSIEKIKDGIKVTFTDNNSVNVHFPDTELPPLENLTVKYVDSGKIYTKKLVDYTSMQVFTGFQYGTNDSLIYYFEDNPVATIGGLNLENVAIWDGSVNGITVENNTITVTDDLIQEGITFDGSNYILKLERGSTSILLGGSGADTISIKDNTISDDYQLYADSGDGDDTISAENIKFNAGVVYINGNAGNDLITVNNVTKVESSSGVAIAGDDTATLSPNQAFFINGGSDDDTISIKNINAPYNTDILDDNGNNLISVTEVTQSGGNFLLYVGKGDDTISVEKASVSGGVSIVLGAGNDAVSISEISATDASFGVDGDDGDNIISVEKATVNGVSFNIYGDADKDTISINEFSATDATVGMDAGDGDNIISIANATVNNLISNIEGGADNDTISISEISSTDATVGVDAGDGDNIISIANATVNNLLSSIEGGADNDTISISKISATDFDIEIDAGGGENIISIANVTLNGYGDLNIYGTDGVNTISAENITVNDEETFNIYAGEGNDNIFVKNSSGVNVTSGEGNDTLIFGDNVTATIADFSTDDLISLSSEISAATFENGVLTLGNVQISLPNVQDISQFKNLQVMSGDKSVKLGKLLGLEYWEVANGVAIYNDEITVSGVSEKATEDDFDWSDETTIKISENALSKDSTVTVNEGYTFELADDVKNKSEETEPLWKVANGAANYMTTYSEGYAVEDNKIIYKAESDGETTMTVTGLTPRATAKQISFDESSKTVSLAAAAVTSEVTITDGFALSMGSGTYSKTTVQGGDGDNTIYNAGNKIVINGNGGADFISLKSGTSANTLNSGAGDDTIISEKGKNIYQYASGDGNDTWQGFTANDSIQITNGEISSWKVEDGNLIFNVGEGSITIQDGAGIKINTAIGKNKNVANVYDAAGILDDKQTAITLRADAKNYTATNTVKVIDGAATDGVEIISNRNADKITGGAGADIIDGAAGNDSIFGGDGADSINGGDGNDKITGDAGDDTILGGKGNDTLDGGEGADLLEGDEGNDKITGDAGDDTLSGGLGNDTLTGGDGTDIFVYSGGNDVIADYTEEDKISLASGEVSSVGVSGKDVTLKIDKGSLKIKNGVGKNVMVNDKIYIYEKGVTFNEDKTVATLTATVKAESLASAVTVDGSAMSAALKLSANASGNVISGGKVGDSILGNAGDDTISGNAGNDKIYGGDGDDIINGGAGDDSIFGGTGNNILTGDLGNDVFIYEGGNDRITDYGTGNDSISLSTAITNASVDGEDVIFETADGKITVSGGADQKIATITKIGSKTTKLTQIYSTLGTYNDKQTAVTLGANVTSYTVPTKPAIVSIDGSATNGVEIIGGTKNEKIFGGDGADTIDGGAGNNSIYGGAGNDSIIGDKGTDKLFGEDGNDTLSGGNGNDTLTGGDGADVFIYSGGNDVIADYDEQDKISLASGEVSSVGISGKDVTLKIKVDKSSGSIKLKNGIGKKVTVDDKVFIYEKGVIYDGDKLNASVTAAATLASSVVNVYTPSLSAALKFSANDSDNYIDGGKGGDSILGGAGNDTIFGNNGTDKLWGDAGNDYLDGGAHNDSIFGGTGNNTLIGGAGNDTFYFEGGNDLITDYEVGKDKIQLTTAIKNASVNGEDVIFETADGKITVSGGAGNKITTVTKIDGKTTTLNQIYTTEGIYNDKKTAITLSADVESYTVPSTVVSLDGAATNGFEAVISSKNTKALKLIGGNGADILNGTSKNDSIFAGGGHDTLSGGEGNDLIYGDDGDDEINGGAGNDSLYGGTGENTLNGGDGKDLFVHEGGDDLIKDYTSKDDTIKFNSEVTSIEVSNSNVIFKTADGGKLTVQNGAGIEITVKDSNNKTFKETYTDDAGLGSRTLDLLYDNNFVTDEFGLDDITTPKFEVQNIDTQNKLELSQPVITYGEDKK